MDGWMDGWMGFERGEVEGKGIGGLEPSSFYHCLHHRKAKLCYGMAIWWK